MTLEEYLNQTEPVRFPTVVLKNEEVTILNSIKVMGEERSLVTIKSDDPIIKDVHYCMIRGRFWTIDRDGNPKSRSVFITEME